MRFRLVSFSAVLGLAVIAALPATASAVGVGYATAEHTIEVPGSAVATAFCPSGEQAMGGAVGPRNFDEDSISARQSYGGTSDWTTFAEADSSNFGTVAFQVAAACLPTSVFAGTGTRRSETIELGPEIFHSPKKPPVDTWTVSCGEGEQVVSGGYAVELRQQGPGIIDAAEVDVSVSRLTTGATGWETTAQNAQPSVAATVTSSAFCLPRQIARGLLDLHYYEGVAKLEAGTVEAFCGAGEQSLGGGFESPRPRSEWPATHFLAYGAGFEARYHSPNVFDHDEVAVDTTCAPPPTAYLGPLDAEAFQGYCEESVAAGSKAVAGAGADEWTCAMPGGETFAIGGDVGPVCLDRYSPSGAGPLPKAVYLDIEDPLSWNCWAGEPGTIEATAVSGSIASSERAATGSSVHRRGGSPGTRLTLAGRVRLPKGISLAHTELRVADLALERSAQGPLITPKDPPDPLPALQMTTDRDSRVRYRGGSSPRVILDLTRLRGRTFRFELTSRGGRFHRPELCHTGRTALTTRFQVLRRGRRLADIEAVAPWRCSRQNYTVEP